MVDDIHPRSCIDFCILYLGIYILLAGLMHLFFYAQFTLWALCTTIIAFNPLSPHDALKHHFTSLKTDLVFLQLRVLEPKFPGNRFTNTW